MNGALQLITAAPTTKALVLAAWIGILAVLPACDGHSADPDTEQMFSSTVDPLDHDPSDTFVRKVFIDGNWVGSAGSGGSGVVSGITLPVKWRPGLTAHVRWERCEPYAKNCQWHELDAPVTQYDLVGMTWVHIMPGDSEVLIIPSMLGPGHPDYPGPALPTKDFLKKTRDADPLRNGGQRDSMGDDTAASVDAAQLAVDAAKEMQAVSPPGSEGREVKNDDE